MARVRRRRAATVEGGGGGLARLIPEESKVGRDSFGTHRVDPPQEGEIKQEMKQHPI